MDDKQNGHPLETPDEDVPGTTEPTTYTNVATGEIISLGSMRQLLRFKRLVPKERFLSSRKGLVEVFAAGDKLKLIQVKA